MISIGLREVLDAEVVNGESEGGTAGAMSPETRSVLDRIIAGGSKMCHELIIG